MFREIGNLLHGRTQYRTECLPVSRVGEVIEGLVNGKNSILEIEGEDDRDFDSKVDLLRRLSNPEEYKVKSIWTDSFSGKKDKIVYFDVYACDKLNKGDVLISGSYTIEHKVRESSRSAWLARV